MRRREFILLASAVVCPLAARAQQSVRRVGVVANFAESDPETRPWFEAFQARLRDLGWETGRNLQIDYRWAAGDADRRRANVDEIVKLKPDVIFGVSTPTIAALQKATSTIPIVFVNANNPVGFGFVKNLARPGGNITGFVSQEPGMGGKWIEILKELAPAVSRIALVHNPQTHTGQYFQEAEAAARALNVSLVRLSYRDATQLGQGLDNFAREPNGGLIGLPDSSNIVNREVIVGRAAQHKLPGIYPYRPFVSSGGLAYYGSNTRVMYQQGADYVDRILRGAKPADLPVQAPAKFELIINLKTAKALGLEVPAFLQQRADEVIE